ncbi:ABC transporter B family member 19 [Linum perenne]
MEAGGEDEQQPPAKGVVEMQEKNIGKVKVDDDDDLKKEAAENKTVSFGELLRYADGVDWMLMGLGTLGSVVHGMAQPVGYLLLGKALNAFGSNINDDLAMVKALDKVVPFVWYMAIATFPAGILEIGCWMYSSERQLARWRIEYLKAVLRQEVGAFDTDLTTGKIITGVTNHMTIIQDAIGEKLGHFLSSFATFFCGVLIAAVSSWEVSLLTLMVVPMILGIGATYTKKMNAISSSKMVYLSSATSMVEETITQIKTVFAFVGETRAVKGFSDCITQQLSLSKVEALTKGIGTGMFQAVTFCSWAIIIWVGAFVVTSGRSSGGDVIAAVMSILFGAISLTYAAPDMQVFNQAMVAGTEIVQVIERKPLITSPDSKEAKTLDKVDGNIEVRDVHFAYPSRPDTMVLKGFSLLIPAGKMVALVGSSGCGKSTIISLVARFYDPLRGDILIDNHNIKDLELSSLRSKIGAVSQEPSLFAGTIMDNLRVGNMEAEDQQIIEAAKMANSDSFISQLPNQYSTQVGQRGVQLSGGQKQRIAIARAILKDPPILLLDEATSALDSESERLVQDALEKAMQGRTVILIAHRMSTIINADIIAVVENGQVSETGTHHSLMQTNTFYNSLCTMQNLKPDDADSRTEESDETIGPIQQGTFPADHQDQSEVAYKPSSPTPVQDMKKVAKKRHNFFRIWYGFRKREMVQTAVGSFAAAFSGISKPFFGFYIITVGVAYYHGHAKRKVGKYSIIFSMIGLISLFSHTLQHYLFGVVGERAMTNLRSALYSGVLKNELGWFEKPDNTISSLTSRIIHDTSTVKIIISDRMSVIVQCVSSILIATVVSMWVDWRMALVAWAVMPCHFIGGLIQAKSAQGFSGDSAATHRELVSLTSESTSNIRTVASFCYEPHILAKAKSSLKHPMKMVRNQSIKFGLIQGVSLCLWNIAHAVALWYTTRLVERGQSSFKDGIRAYQIFSLTVPSITELWTLIPAVVSAMNVLAPAFETLDRKTEIEPDQPKADEFKLREGRVEFQNIKFNYPLRPEVTVLNNFSLQIEPGLKVALVGPSGAGKSSVLALLLRFYDPLQGNVMIDGKNIKEYNLRMLRRQIGLVQQEPLLFSYSIRDNIKYGNEEASEAEVVQVSREANIHGFVSNLPDGYDTVVGDRGCQLSGGQKQRIAIARTLLKRPAILLLDEATSALDTESERSIVNALESISENNDIGRITQITVAHRLSTIRKSDSIVVMDKGEIVEMGTHSSLLASSGGVYSRLYELQNLA